MKPWVRLHRTTKGYREIRGGVGYQFGWIPAKWAFVVWNSEHVGIFGGSRWFSVWSQGLV